MTSATSPSINTAVHTPGCLMEEPSPSTSAESDIPTLCFSSMSNTPTASQIDEDEHYYRQHMSYPEHLDMDVDGRLDLEMHLYRDGKPAADLEDDEEDVADPDDQAEAATEDEEEAMDDIEASFLRCTKPICSKTTLVSCLSSRSTSPGPLSPLLSDEDFVSTRSISSALSESEHSSGPPSANLSRRSSAGTPSEASSHRVRFKKGCVITEVNLTWAPASYDRAPIDVAESLDIKRCHSLDDDGECDSGSDNDYDEEDAGYERDDPDFEEGEIDACGEWVQGLHCNDVNDQPSDTDDEVDERFYYYSGTSSTSPIPLARPPSPPLPSSPCTSMQVSMAYHHAFGGSTPTQSSVMRQRCEQEEAEAANRVSPPSSVASSVDLQLPPLVTDDSSCSDSSNEEYFTKVHQIPLHGQTITSATPTTSSLNTPSTIKDCYFDGEAGNTATPTIVNASSSATRPRRDESPSTVGDQPIRKVPRYAACLDRFKAKAEDLYSNCEALGGF